jgi:tetratricopeptide (TPR) repeat protein
LVTLDECPDFHETIQYSSKRIDRMVEHHTSTALKGKSMSDMTNEQARAAYLEHAKKMMVISTQHHPWAAELLYALAKTYERELAVDTTRPTTLRSQSIACLEAAHQIAPSYSYIANELGYSLIQAQRLQDAQLVLLTVVQSEPSAPAWRNLAEVYRRRGAIQDAAQALERAAAMEHR